LDLNAVAEMHLLAIVVLNLNTFCYLQASVACEYDPDLK